MAPEGCERRAFGLESGEHEVKSQQSQLKIKEMTPSMVSGWARQHTLVASKAVACTGIVGWWVGAGR